MTDGQSEACEANPPIRVTGLKERDHQDLRDENAKLRDLCRRSLAIITDAIMHGMPITEEVARVRNLIVALTPPHGLSKRGKQDD